MKKNSIIDKKFIAICTTLPVVSATSALAETGSLSSQDNLDNSDVAKVNKSNYRNQDIDIDLNLSAQNTQPEDAESKDKIELGQSKLSQTVNNQESNQKKEIDIDIEKNTNINTNINTNKTSHQHDSITNKPSANKPSQELTIETRENKSKQDIHQSNKKQTNDEKAATPSRSIAPPENNHPELNQSISSTQQTHTIAATSVEPASNRLNAEEKTSLPASIPTNKVTEVTPINTENIENSSVIPSQTIPTKNPDSDSSPAKILETNEKQLSTRSQISPTPIKIENKTNSRPKNINPTQPPETIQSIGQEVDEVRIITPLSGETTAKTTNLAIQYHPENDIRVTLNGKPLDPELTSHIHTDNTANIHTKIWYNVPLKIGENTIGVQGKNGTVQTIKITRIQQQAQLTISPANQLTLPADGRSTIKINGKITNENNKIIREDILVTLTTTAGKFVGADNDTDAPGFQVMARDGEFSVELQAALEPQNVKVRAAIDNWKQADNSSSQLEAYTNIELITNLRPSLATGSINLRIGAGGTDYHSRFRDFLNPDKTGRTDFDIDAAVFATGKVGDWLFTGAYNSDRALNEDCNGDNRLFAGVQNCEKAYPVYGDASNVTATTPSIDSVYAKFERTPNISGAESDYFMWGDYNTQEFARNSQLFSATTRQLHGFKGNYNLGNFQVTALFANNIEGFQRDNIAPNGTSGYYFLSRRDIVPGTENIFIESEEINRPGTIVKRQSLQRGPDYEIDYDRGTIMFRRRIFATELNPFGSTLTNRIIVTYQNDAGSGSKLYAGRAQYNFRDRNNPQHNQENTPFIGATYLWEDQDAQNFELIGADAFIPLGKDGHLIGEYAHSRHNSLAFGYVDGSAYRLEATASITPNLKGNAFYRSVSENFANNATFSFVPGQTRYGASLNGKLSSTTSFNLVYDHEDNFGTAPALRTTTFDLFNPQPQAAPGTQVDNSLTTFRAGIGQKIGDADIGIEYVNRDREDRIDDRFDANASQLVSKANIPLTPSLTFRAQNELNLGQKDAFYPNRTTLGLDWGLYPGITMRLAHQFFEGGVIKGNSITSLDTLVEHKFSEDTSVTGRYSIFSGIDGMNDQAALGLNHRIRLAPGLKLNLGYERIQNNLFGNNPAGISFAQPYSTGQTGFTLGISSGNSYSIGLDYTDNPNFQANARFEYRDGQEGDNMVISGAAAGKLSPALTAAVRYQQAGGANQLLGNLPDTAHLRLGLAYRDPSNDKFNALLGYEYRLNPSTTPDTLLAGNGSGSSEHLFSAEAIYAPNWQWEFYGKYALRNNTSYLANDFTNTSTAHLAQLRTTYQLGYRSDLALEGRWLGQPSEGFNEFGLALEGGYYLTPDLRIGVGYAFGSADDRDFTGYRSAGGPYLNINYKINELFAGFGRQKPAPKQQQESEVQPVANKSETAIASVSASKKPHWYEIATTRP